MVPLAVLPRGGRLGVRAAGCIYAKGMADVSTSPVASQTQKKINEFSHSRNSDAKRTGHLIMSNGKGPDGLSGRHLENLN